MPAAGHWRARPGLGSGWGGRARGGDGV